MLTDSRDRQRRRKYGLTPEGYATLLQSQHGVCAICAQPPKPERYEARGHDELVVDHDHATGLVRGLLCGACNTRLGRIKDDAAWMERAAGYLRQGAPTVTGEAPPPPPSMVTVEEPVEEALPTTPRSRCAVADRSGERHQQLEALAFAFAQRFAGHNVPSSESLKRLLQLAGSAEAVDEVFESASTRKPEHPFSYVRAVLERTQKPVETAIGPTPRPPAVVEEELPEATAEQRARWKANDEKLRRLGILPRDGGDAW